MTALRRSHSSSGNIPFLWEHHPGISKVMDSQTNNISTPSKSSLPPPPCSTTTDSPFRQPVRSSIYVPLPPCPFVPTQDLSTSARKGMKKMDDHGDPFLTAFMECTKCSKKEVKKRKSLKEKVMEMRVFSCKYDVGVRKDVMIGVQDWKKMMEVKEE